MHFRQWLARKILSQAKRVHAWAAMQLIDEPWVLEAHEKYSYANYVAVPQHMRAMARQVVERELDQVVITARVIAFNTESEQDVIRKRLARRYDPGMALNEAFARAAEKAKNEPHPVSGESQELTGKQVAALKFQEEFLRRNAQRG